jgi:hypothetical protein
MRAPSLHLQGVDAMFYFGFGFGTFVRMFFDETVIWGS